MPLIKSATTQARSTNIATEINAGKPRAQAIAIGYSVQRQAKGRKKKTFARAKQDRKKADDGY